MARLASLWSTGMSYPILVVLTVLAWIAGGKLIDWAYNREHTQH
jgi:hypothetical protein